LLEHHTDISDIFTASESHTTFFINGNNWSCIYDDANVEAIRASYTAGHQLAHHGVRSTFNTSHVTTLTYEEIDTEIGRLNEAFVRILGVKPKFYRPPYGAINDTAATYIQQKFGLTIVLWSTDSFDASGHPDADWNYNYYNDLAALGSGIPHMTLSHETVDGSYYALERGTLDGFTDRHISLVTTADCLGMDAYETVTGYFGTKDDSWTCEDPQTTTSSTPASTSTSTATATATASNLPSGCASMYITPSKTTCDAVGSQFSVSANAIKSANSFVNCADIWQGTTLCIPTPDSPTATGTGTTTATSSSSAATQSASAVCTSRYTARAGDTCASIGSQFGLTVHDVETANTFLNCNDIWVNTPICIVGGSTATGTSSSVAATPTCASTYTSAAGDTCASIASKHGLTASNIQSANTFLDCNNIWAWTRICIPPGGNPVSQCTRTYTSKLGDTCESIGREYGTTASQIQAWNTFLTCTDIWANTSVCVSHS
ncbi:glycoside hydrolase/deacetylase, partial [Serendipita vermifera]